MRSAEGQAGGDSAFEAVFAEHADEVFRFSCAIAGEKDAGPLLRRVARLAATEFDDQRDSDEQRQWLLGLAFLESVAAEPAEPAAAATAPAAAAPEAAAGPDAAAAAAAAEPGIREQVAAFGKTELGGLFLRELTDFGYDVAANICHTTPDVLQKGVTDLRRALQPHLPREGPMCDIAREIMADDEPDAAAEATLGEHLDQCSECPKVEADMAGIAAALDKALPHIAQSLLLAVLKEANAFASEAPPSSPEPDAGRGDRLSRYSRRSLALAGAALVLVTAGALGLGAATLDRPGNVANLPSLLSQAALTEAMGIAGATDESREPPCPIGTERVGDHCEPPCPDGTERIRGVCEPECPEGTRRVDGECQVDCPVGTVRVDGECQVDCPDGFVQVEDECFVDPPGFDCPPGTQPVGRRCLLIITPVCRFGVLRNGRCFVDVVCPRRTVFRRGRCERLPVCPPRTVEVRNGVCELRARCPKGTKRISRNRCRGPVVCPVGTTRDGLVCRAPVVCPGNSTPVGNVCVRPAECPPRTTLVGGRCELPPVCPEHTTPTPQGCIGDVVCPPRTIPQGGRCVLPCRGTLWRLTHPCLEPDPDPEWVDRHGDSHGRGHRPGGGKGHDPTHNAGAVPLESAPDPTSVEPSDDPTAPLEDPAAPFEDPTAPEPEPGGPPPPAYDPAPAAGGAPPAPARPAPPAPAASPPAPAPGSAAQPGRGHAPGQQRRAERDRGHSRQIPPVAMLLISAMVAPAVSRAGRRRRRRGRP